MNQKPPQWEWSPERVPEHMRAFARSTITLLPLWRSARNNAYDFGRRKIWTAANTNGADGSAGRYITQITGGKLESGLDLLGGLSEFTATAVIDATTLPKTSANALSSQWNAETVFLWRHEGTRRMRCLMDTSVSTYDTTSTNNSMSSSGLTVMSVRYDGANLHQFFNGVKNANSVSASGTVDNLTTAQYVVGTGTGGSDLDWNVPYYLLHVARRAFSDGEMSVLHANIWHLLAEEDDAPMFAFGPAAAPPAGTGYPIIHRYYTDLLQGRAV